MTTDSSAAPVLIEEHDNIALIKLNRPERLNAWSPEMAAPMNEYFARVNSGDYRIRCIILTGEGRAFCSGADVSGLASRSAGGERPPWRPPHLEVSYTQTMRQCDVPIIGAINGYAIGMGWGIAHATDVRIAADDAKFQVTQVKRGLFADGGLGHYLPRDVGTQRALELMFTGRMIDADEALALGLVLRVVPRDQLIDAAFELAREIVKNGPMSLAASKRVVYMQQDDAFRQAQLFTAMGIERLFFTDDAKEGVRSFVERREPQFQGR